MTLGRTVVTCLVWACLAWAEDWGAVRRLEVGSQVEVKREDRRVFRGAVGRVTENQLELSGTAGRMRFGRSTVRVVRVKQAGWRGRWLDWMGAGWTTVYEAGGGR